MVYTIFVLCSLLFLTVFGERFSWPFNGNEKLFGLFVLLDYYYYYYFVSFLPSCFSAIILLSSIRPRAWFALLAECVCMCDVKLKRQNNDSHARTPSPPPSTTSLTNPSLTCPATLTSTVRHFRCCNQIPFVVVCPFACYCTRRTEPNRT